MRKFFRGNLIDVPGAVTRLRNRIAIYIAARDRTLVYTDGMINVARAALDGTLYAPAWNFPESEPFWGEGDYIYVNGDWVRG